MNEEQARATVHGWAQAVDATWERARARMPLRPTHQQLMRHFQVEDDPRGMVDVLGYTITADERDAMFNLWPWELSHYRLLTQDAMTQADEVVFPGVGREGHGDNHRDAFRHAFWNSQLVDTLGADKAEELATVHEARPDTEPRGDAAEAMDLYNNSIGRELAEQHPEATRDEMVRIVQQAVREGRMVVLDETGQLVPSDYDFKPK